MRQSCCAQGSGKIGYINFRSLLLGPQLLLLSGPVTENTCVLFREISRCFEWSQKQSQRTKRFCQQLAFLPREILPVLGFWNTHVCELRLTESFFFYFSTGVFRKGVLLVTFRSQTHTRSCQKRHRTWNRRVNTNSCAFHDTQRIQKIWKKQKDASSMNPF